MMSNLKSSSKPRYSFFICRFCCVIVRYICHRFLINMHSSILIAFLSLKIWYSYYSSSSALGGSPLCLTGILYTVTLFIYIKYSNFNFFISHYLLKIFLIDQRAHPLLDKYNENRHFCYYDGNTFFTFMYSMIFRSNNHHLTTYRSLGLIL